MGRALFRTIILCIGSIVMSANAALSQPVADLYFGSTQAALAKDHQPWAFGLGTGGGLSFSLNKSSRLRVGLDWRRLWDDTASASVLKFPHPNDRAARVWTATAVSVTYERPMGMLESIAPYMGLGFGVMHWRIGQYPGNEELTVEKSDGQNRSYSADEAIIKLALGIEPSIRSNFRLRVQLGVDLLTGVGAHFSDAIDNERSHAQVNLTIGASFPFGTGRISPIKSSDRPVDFMADGYITPVSDAPQFSNEPNADADGDGIFNDADQCPGTPSGAVVDRNGCPLDGDQDGVFDGLDLCPGTVEADRAHVDAHGCVVAVTELAEVADDEPVAIESEPLIGPVDDGSTTENEADLDAAAIPDEPEHLAALTHPDINDTDQDGIPDEHDNCPHTPRGLSVDSHGCLIMTELKRRLILHVTYLPGTTDLDWLSKRVLDDLIVRLRRVTELNIMVEGFTDNIGDAEANRYVSQKRADKVRDYLIAKGIVKDRIIALGRGEQKFIASNETAEGRQKNRRIEITCHPQ